MGFDTLQPTDEWKVAGPGPHGAPTRTRCSSFGLLASRMLEGADLTSWKPFGPHDAIFAATVVIQPHGPLATWREQSVELVLYDPAHEEVFDFLERAATPGDGPDDSTDPPPEPKPDAEL